MLDFPCSRTFRDWDMERQGQPGLDYADETDCRDKIWGEIMAAWRAHSESWWFRKQNMAPPRPKTTARPIPTPSLRPENLRGMEV